MGPNEEEENNVLEFPLSADFARLLHLSAIAQNFAPTVALVRNDTAWWRASDAQRYILHGSTPKELVAK